MQKSLLKKNLLQLILISMLNDLNEKKCKTIMTCQEEYRRSCQMRCAKTLEIEFGPNDPLIQITRKKYKTFLGVIFSLLVSTYMSFLL